MKLNLWTTALAAAGVVSLGSVAQAEEAENQVMTAVSSTTLSGYVSTSAIWKFGTGNASMPGRVFDGTGKQDGFNLDVVKLTVEKPLDESEWAAGYKVDLLFGPDAGTYNPGVLAANDVAIKQAFVNVRVPAGNGIDVKMGVFDTCIGYEVFDTPANPNYSRSYAYGIEPFAHTGVLASYKVNDILAFSAGVANTYSTGINTRATAVGRSESEKTYMGLVSLTAPESAGFLAGASLYAGIIDGINTAWPASDTTHYYVGGTMPTPVEGLSLGAAYDYRGTKEVGDPSAGGVNSTYANAVAGYVSYQATEKLKLNGRVEYATATTGTWYFSNQTNPNNELLGVTATVDYALWENVLSRLEFRWDRCDEKVFGGDANSDPDKNALTLALNLVYKF
jgi:hypothetical protein